MNPILPTSRLRRCPQIIAQTAAGATVLLSVDRGQYYSLEDVGTRAWELCDGSRTVGEMAALLAAEYAVAEHTVSADLVELLTELANEDLVEAVT